MSDWILMIKGGEQKLVHPGNVSNHLRAGWHLADEPAVQEPTIEPDLPAAVAVETDAAAASPEASGAKEAEDVEPEKGASESED